MILLYSPPYSGPWEILTTPFSADNPSVSFEPVNDCCKRLVISPKCAKCYAGFTHNGVLLYDPPRFQYRLGDTQDYERVKQQFFEQIPSYFENLGVNAYEGLIFTSDLWFDLHKAYEEVLA